MNIRLSDEWDKARWENFKKAFKIEGAGTEGNFFPSEERAASTDTGEHLQPRSGNSYLRLARYASFPILLSSDLIYKIYLNFILPGQEVNEEGEIPLWQVSEFLFSPIVREIGYDLYEIHSSVKADLKNTLKSLFVADKDLPENVRMAHFMAEYLDKCRARIYTPTLAKAEELNYKMELNPMEAVKGVLDIIQRSKDAIHQSEIRYLLEWGRERLHEKLQAGETAADLESIYEAVENLVRGLADEDADQISHALQNSPLEILPPGASTAEGYTIHVDQATYAQLDLNFQQEVAAVQPRLFALLIGIETYQAHGPVEDAVHHIRALENYLHAMQGFEADITVLAEAQATRQAIVQNFREILGKATQDDTVLIYFTGREGTETTDTGIWKSTELHGIICHEERAARQTEYFLTHKELQFLIWELYNDTRAHIALVLDACRPEGSLKETENITLKRRRAEAAAMPFPPRRWEEFLFAREISPQQVERAANITDLFPQLTYLEIDSRHADNQASATGDHGLFTRTLLRTLQDSGGNLTYRELFTRISQYMKLAGSDQAPAIYAPLEKERLLDTGFLNRPVNYAKIPCQAIFNPQTGWQLNVGAIHGLNASSVVSLIHTGTRRKYTGVIRPGEIYIDYAFIGIENAETVENTVLKGEIEGIILAPMRLAVVNHDMQANETRRIADALQAASVYSVFSEEPDADYVLHLRDGTAYFTLPRDPYRPLTRPTALKDDVNYDLLKDYYQSVSRWHFIKNLQNPADRQKADPLRIEISRITSNGSVAPVSLSGDTARLTYEKKGTEGHGNIEIRVTNTTQQDLYICAAYLSGGFGCFLDFLPGKVYLLQAGASVLLGPDGKGIIRLELDDAEKEYNRKESTEYIRFFTKPSPFEANALALEEIPGPETVSDRIPGDRGLATKGQTRGLFVQEHLRLGGDWATQLLPITFLNPFFGELSHEMILEMYSWPSTSYFARGLYFEQIVPEFYRFLPTVVAGDCQKGRWGGSSQAGSYTLSAEVEREIKEQRTVPIWSESAWPVKPEKVERRHTVTIHVRSNRPGDDQQVAVFLHQSFSNQVNYLRLQDGQAQLTVSAYEAFTVGAYLADGSRLELDMNRQEGYPEDFYYEHIGDILWVDDKPEKNNRRVIKTLEKSGYVFFQAWDTAQAIALLQLYPLDLIFSDMVRGDNKRAGIELLEYLKNQRINIPTVILSSNYDVGGFREEALRLGARDVLSIAKFSAAGYIRSFFSPTAES